MIRFGATSDESWLVIEYDPSDCGLEDDAEEIVKDRFLCAEPAASDSEREAFRDWLTGLPLGLLADAPGWPRHRIVRVEVAKGDAR